MFCCSRFKQTAKATELKSYHNKRRSKIVLLSNNFQSFEVKVLKMEKVLRELNLSFEDFEGLNNIESLISTLERSELKVSEIDFYLGEEFLNYGIVKRSQGNFEEVLKSKKKLFDFYNTRRVGVDLMAEKILAEKCLEYDDDEKYKKAVSDYKERADFIDIMNNSAVAQSDNQFINFFLLMIPTGKKTEFIREISSVTDSTRQSLNLVAITQLFRAIWKLEDRLSGEKNKFESVNICMLLARCYALIKVDKAKLKMADEIEKALEKDIEVGSQDFDNEEIFDMIQAKIDETGEYKVDKIMDGILDKFKLSTKTYSTLR